MLLIQLRDLLLVMLYEAADLLRLLRGALVQSLKFRPPVVESGLILAQQRVTSECHARSEGNVQAVGPMHAWSRRREVTAVLPIVIPNGTEQGAAPYSRGLLHQHIYMFAKAPSMQST